MKRVLAVETSCDETAAAVVERAGDGVRVLSNVVASQADLHRRTGGVVPEAAARAHVEAITYVIDDALRAAQLRTQNPEPGTIDAVAVTTEPGLRPALVVGEAAARALAVAWGKPFVPVNHLAGHVAAAWLPREEVRSQKSEVRATWFAHQFPAVVLIVSGGHTQLWKLSDLRPPTSDVRPPISDLRPPTSDVRPPTSDLRLLGQTRDDAAGEAFDKIARLLGLPYPGGPALAALARSGDARAFSFPRPMAGSGDDDFSFSGLKTAVLYGIRGKNLLEQQRADVAASAQAAIADVLVAKTVRAAAREGAREVILTGGVAANARLRETLGHALGDLPLIVPHPAYCTDNAAMIGAAAVLGVRMPGEPAAPRSGVPAR